MKRIDLAGVPLMHKDVLVRMYDHISATTDMGVRRTQSNKQLDDEVCVAYAYVNSRTTWYLLVREKDR